MATNENLMRTSWYVTDAWRAVLVPDAIIEALAMGEQIIDLLTHAISLVGHVCADKSNMIDTMRRRPCQRILDQLHGQTDQLDPVLRRLRSVGKAVTS